jgi:hypothetical protein
VLFQANDFDMEDIIVHKQWVHDGHIKIVSMTSSVGEYTEKICKQQVKHQSIIIWQSHKLHVQRC